MKKLRVDTFPIRRLPRIGCREIEVQSTQDPGRWLADLRLVSSSLARRLGLGAAELSVARITTLRLEDLRGQFAGRWRFAQLIDPAAGRLGFLALDPLLVGRLTARLGEGSAPARGWLSAPQGVNGAVGWLLALALDELAGKADGERWGGWRYGGLIESPGEVGRACFDQELLVATWLDVRAGWDKGHAVWLEPEASVNGRNRMPGKSAVCAAELAAVGELQVMLSCRLGKARLQTAELAGLEVGDVVLLSESCADDELLLEVGELAISARRREGCLEIERLHIEEGGWMMEEQQQLSSVAGDGLDAARLGDLPLEVIAEAGRLKLSVGQVAGLKAGDVLTMPHAVLGPLELRVQGRLVARGELVDVEGRRGVRVCELALVQEVGDEDLVD